MRYILCFLLLLPLAVWGQQPRTTALDMRVIQRMSIPQTGAEHLVSDSLLMKRLSQLRVAVVANQTSVVGRGQTHLVDTLVSRGIKVQKIFCPEHGFRGNKEAGASIKDGIDQATGILVVSLYGNNKKPTADQLKGIDLMLFDLQDVGCRFYTYISTLHYVMEACAENKIPVVVLDRPNPNIAYVEGPVLEARHQSFVGMHPVPICYGMTIGEYAKMINGEHWLGMTSREGKWVKPSVLECQLTVVPMRRYTRQTDYTFPVAPSPNLPNAQAIRMYPSLCLFEGTNISVGRGTEYPFQWVGAPSFNRADMPDSLVLASFTPHPIAGVSEHPPFDGRLCRGLDLRQFTKGGFSPWVILYMYQHSSKETFFLKNGFFDRLAGTSSLRQQIQNGLSSSEIEQSWQPALEEFKAVRQKYLIYQ